MSIYEFMIYVMGWRCDCMPFMNNDRPEEILKRRILLAKAKLISNREYLKTILDIREKDLRLI